MTMKTIQLVVEARGTKNREVSDTRVIVPATHPFWNHRTNKIVRKPKTKAPSTTPNQPKSKKVSRIKEDP